MRLEESNLQQSGIAGTTVIGKSSTRQVLGKYASVVGLAVLIGMSIMLSRSFLSPNNLVNVLRQLSIVGFMALGMTMVIISGGIDLSMGGVLGFSAVMSALLINKNPFLAIVLPLLAGLFFGAMNGLAVTKGRVEPFICTIGMQTIARGFAFIACNGRTVLPGAVPRWLDFLANGKIGPLPAPFFLLLAAFVGIGFILSKTVAGRYIYAVGGNAEAARLAGINVDLVRMCVFVASGFLAALAGIFHFSRISVGDPTAGTGFELLAISATIVGGNSFSGGIGGVTFTMIGLLIIQIITNILNLTGVTFYWQEVVRGAMIIGAVLVSRRQK